MVFFILLIIVLNLGIGFAVAVYVAHEADAAGISASPAPFLREPSLPDRADTPKSFPEVDAEETPEVAPVAAEETALESEEEPSADATPEETPEEMAAEAVSPGEPDADAAPLEYEAIETAGDESCEEMWLGAIGPSPHQVSVMAIQEEVKRYSEALMELSDQLRLPPEDGNGDWFEERRHSLRSTNDEYLKSRNLAYEAFESLSREVDHYPAICDSLGEMMTLQASKIGEANQALDAYRFQGDLSDGCRRMLGETSKLTDLNHQMRDSLEEAMVGLAREEKWLESSDENVRTDPLTGVTNRIGLEAGLAEWWARDPHRVRLLSAALIDLDHFGKLNERYGQTVADGLLRAVAQLLREESKGCSLMARQSGQRFVLLFPDMDLQAAATAVDRVRQVVETTHFERGDEEIQTTLSCGVIEVTSKDTSESLLERADLTVREAKRYGRNRSFLHDGKFPTAMVPPNLQLEERRIPLE